MEEKRKEFHAEPSRSIHAEPSRSIQWKAPEFYHFTKSPSWYVIIVGAAVALLVLSVWQKNFLFGVFIAIAAGLMIYFGRKEPRVLEFKIDDEGIAIEDDRFYTYSDLKSFWIRRRAPELDELVIVTKSAFKPHLKILCQPQLEREIKDFLKPQLKEAEHEDSVIDALAEWLGF